MWITGMVSIGWNEAFHSVLPSPDKKTENIIFGSHFWGILGRILGYLGVFGGGFWMVFGGVCMEVLRGNITQWEL